MASRKPEQTQYATQMINLQTGALSGGTYIGNAVGQAVTYTANSLNLGGN